MNNQYCYDVKYRSAFSDLGALQRMVTVVLLFLFKDIQGSGQPTRIL